ncbi:MAG: hypothetical protein M1822_008913 [Bathelium mastoideum]|nr:MAG: hypothetical protein M1822_008913 [Bathelium mastoideum]
MAESHRAATERTSLLRVQPDPVDGPVLVSTISEDVDCGGRDGTPAEGLSRLRRSLIFICLGALTFLQATNTSLLTTTQGFIAEELDAFQEVSWFTSTYLIAMSSLAPLGGRICKIISPRTYILFSILIFCIGVIVTAIATNLPVFILGRAISGTGSAGIFSVSMILVVQLSSFKRRGLLIGLMNTALTLGVSLGAVIAGAMRPVFWLQAPIASAIGVVILLSSPPEVCVPEGGHKRFTRSQLAQIDFLGALTWVTTIVLFLYGLSAQKILPLPLLLSLATCALFLLIEARFAVAPVLPISILRSRATLCSCLATLGLMMARWLVLFYSPVYTIAVRGWPQDRAGLILLPTNTGFGFGGLIAGWVHIRRRGSFYVACLVTFICFSAALALVAMLATAESSAVAFMAAAFVNGAVAGAILNYTLAHLIHLTPRDTHTIVTPLLATFRGFAGSFGSAIGGGIFARTLQQSLVAGFADAGLEGREDLIRRLLGSPALAARLEGTERQVAIRGFQTALQTLFLAGSALALVSTVVQAGTGWRGPGEEKDAEDLEEDSDGPEDEHRRS